MYGGVQPAYGVEQQQPSCHSCAAAADGSGDAGLASGVVNTVGNTLAGFGVPGGDIVNAVAGGLGAGGI